MRPIMPWSSRAKSRDLGAGIAHRSLDFARDDILRTRAKVRVGYPWWLRPLLARDVIAITLGRRIYLSAKTAAMHPESLERLLRHELAHVRQVERLGLFIFLWRYVAEFLRHLRRERSFGRAYRLISFEIEAVAAEEAYNRPGH